MQKHAPIVDCEKNSHFPVCKKYIKSPKKTTNLIEKRQSNIQKAFLWHP